MIDIIIRLRWIIIAGCLIIGTGFAALIPFSKTDPEIRNYVPQSMKSRIATNKIEEEFGVQDLVVILFSDSCILNAAALKQIKMTDRAISRLKGVSNRLSPFTIKEVKGDSGMMTVNPLIPAIPIDAEGYQQLRKTINNSKFARDIVFSSDMTTAAITATINNDVPENQTLSEIDSIIISNSGNARVQTGGLPYIRHHLLKDVRSDGLYLIPAALIIILLILKLTLGNWKSVMMPFTVVILSTGISMGLIPLLGWKFSIITLLVPVIIVAVANNYGIYLVARHQELSRDWKESKVSLLKRLTGSLNMPILFSGLTTIAGILGLLTHSIIPAKQVGILAATGVTIALIMSLVLIPALISIVDPGTTKPVSEKLRNNGFERILRVVSRIIINNPRKVLVISIVLTLLVSFGFIFLRIDTNQENYFPARSPIRSASAIINQKFGGSQTISVMIEGDIKDPLVMKGIDNLTLQAEKMPGAGKVFSISQVVREMSKAIYQKEEKGYDNIPEDRNAIAQMFELYNMSGDQSDFRQLLSPDDLDAHILIRLSDPENKVIMNIQNKLKILTSGFPAKVTVGGYAIIMTDFARSVINGQISSLLFAVLTVFLLLAIIFRSFRGGLTGSIPLVFSIIILFGFMGLTGITLDSATALLSSIMIGVGVDFTIQFMWCFNSELRKGLTFEDATAETMTTIGRSIIINALSVMAGFSALMFSGFTSIRFFGYLVVISIGSCLLGALIIIPAYLIVFKPRFILLDLNKRKKRKNEESNNTIIIDSAAYTGSSTTT
jgi:uncharacterized protein